MTIPSAPPPTRAVRIFVAIVVYEGVMPETCMALISLTTLGAIHAPDGTVIRLEWYFHFEARCSIQSRVRAMCATIFLDRGDDLFLFVDADSGFDKRDIARLISAGKPIAGLAFGNRQKVDYPAVRDAVLRGDPEYAAAGSITALFLPPQTIGPDGFAEAPVGFGVMLIRRDVIEAVAAAHPELYFGAEFEDGTTRMVPGIFTLAIDAGRLVGEDIAFCRRALAIGHKSYVLIDADTTHYGTIGARCNLLKSMVSSGAATAQAADNPATAQAAE